MEKSNNTFKEFWRKYHLLVLGLTFPLLALSALFLFLASPFSISGLLLNIATDFITLIITIWYVDWILKGHEEAKWKGTRKYITSLAGGIAHGLVSVVVEKTSLSDEIFPKNEPPLYTRSISDIQQEILENVMRLDRDKLIAHLDKLSAKQWQILFQSIGTFPNEISAFLAQFGPRLSPSELESILSLRRDIASVISSYDLFKSFLGVSVESMPKVKDGKPWDYAAISTIRSGIELQIVLQRAINVITVFEYVAEQPDLDWNKEVSKSWSKYRAISRFNS